MGRLLREAFKWFDESLLAGLKGRRWPEIGHSESMVMALKKDWEVPIVVKRKRIANRSTQRTLPAGELKRWASTKRKS